VLGLTLILTFRPRRLGIAFVTLGVTWTAASLAVIHAYSGGVSPFDVRYGPALGAGPAGTLAALTRPEVVAYARTLLLGGGWLGLVVPLSVLSTMPTLALNAVSTSPWMAAGKAHYSGLVLPFLVLGAAAGLQWVRGRRWVQSSAAVAVVVTALVGYRLEGAGPLAANYAPALVTPHAQAAEHIAASLPPGAAVSATTSLVPHLTHRARAYVFPAIQDADYAFLDLQASPAPTSARDVYLRVQSLLDSGEWHVDTWTDGLLLLERGPDPFPVPAGEGTRPRTRPTLDHNPTLVSASLVPSPDGAVDVDGPRWTLHTVWRADQPLPAGARPDFWIDLDTGERLHAWDLASVWWNPPDQWPMGQPVAIDVPNIPEREFTAWSATWSTP
jgi:hypothetical protein